MTEQDQKYLAEKMGLCWHEWTEEIITPIEGETVRAEYCKKCEQPLWSYEQFDFSSPSGFFLLFQWAKKQDWWDEFLDQFHHQIEAMYQCLPINLIGPRFAEELVKFLRSRE